MRPVQVSSVSRSVAIVSRPLQCSASSSSVSVVLKALLGCDPSPRGRSAWTTKTVLNTVAVRNDNNHFLNNANGAVRNMIINVLNERQPFQPAESELIALRSCAHDEMDKTTATNTSEHDVSVSHWFSTWTTVVRSRLHWSSDCLPQLQHIVDDILFPLLQHEAFVGQDLRQLASGMHQIAAFASWLTDEVTANAVMGTPSIVSPRWMRKLRKSLCDSGALGSTMVFASGLIEVWQAEERLARPTALTQDVELLQFIVSIPSRRDSGLPRHDISDATMKMLDFMASRLWKQCVSQGANALDALSKALDCASNGVAFSLNNQREAERLCTIFIPQALASCSEGDTVGIEVLTTIMNSAVDAAERKARALHFTTTEAYVETIVTVAYMQQWVMDTCDTTRATQISVSDVLSTLQNLSTEASSLPASVLPGLLKQIASFIVTLAVTVRAPDVFDRIVGAAVAVVDRHLALLGLTCKDVETFVTAVSSAAPPQSMWLAVASGYAAASAWSCGCGATCASSSASCAACTIASNRARYTCLVCSGAIDVKCDTSSCPKCKAEHPRVLAAVAANGWGCSSCGEQIEGVTTAACTACHAPNAMHHASCTACGHFNHTTRLHCSLCGEGLRSPQVSSAPSDLIYCCRDCQTFNETPDCQKCASKERSSTQDALQPTELIATHMFRWQCGCGAWNGAMDRRCHRCCPVEVRGKVTPTTVLYTCSGCRSPCDGGHVEMKSLPLVPHMNGGPNVSVASCRACHTWHPRDEQLLQAPRIMTCSACEEVVVLPHAVKGQDTTTACPSCRTIIPPSDVRTAAVVDLPWVCHACGDVNHRHESNNLMQCKTCDTHSTPPVVFSPTKSWQCNACGKGGLRGYSCSRCHTVNHHLPKPEVRVWQCSCSSWQSSWAAQCTQCGSSKTLSTIRAECTSWDCSRCRRPNGPTLSRCHQCGVHRQKAPVPVPDLMDQHETAKDMLLAAAHEAQDDVDGRQLHMHTFTVNHVEDDDVGDLVRQLSLSHLM